MVSTNSLKNGMTLKLDGKLWKIVEWNHHKPGKGGAVVRTKLKAVETGKVVDRTFRAGEEVEQAIIERKTLQYLYNDGQDLVFMDSDTYEQKPVKPETIGDAVNYLLEGEQVDIAEFEGEIIGVEMPSSVELEVIHTEPGLAGDTASGNATKPATLQTGLEIQVPLFIDIGEKIKVDTRNGSYMSRA